MKPMKPTARAIEIATRIWKQKDTSVFTIARIIDAEAIAEIEDLHAVRTALRSVARHKMPDGTPCWCNEYFHAQAFAGFAHSPSCTLARQSLFVQDATIA